MKKILLVDDDRKMLDVMRRYLEGLGFSVIFTDNGSEALMLARESKPDLIVSDVVMPGLNGLDLCAAIKRSAETAATPVIIISGEMTGDDDVVAGYDQGADDYLAKPFAFSVLAAKINAVLRRFSVSSGPALSKIREKGLELDPAARTVKLGRTQISLTRKEFDLLALMLEKKGRLLGVPYMLETVWGYDMGTYDNPHTVESHISALRKKLGPKFAARLVSVSGHGYKFE